MNNVRLIHYSQPQELIAFSPKGALVSVVEKPPADVLARAKRVRRAFCEYGGPPLEDVRLSITLRCNLDCKHCSVCAGRRVDLPLGLLAPLFGELRDMGVLTVTLSGGEPLMRNDFCEIVDAAHREGLTININTNGTLVSKSIVRKLCKRNVSLVDVSLDGATPATHALLRGSGASHSATLAGLKSLTDCGVPVRISTVLHKAVLPEIEQLLAIASRLRVKRVSLLELIPLGRATSVYSQFAPTRTELWGRLEEINEVRRTCGFDIELEGYTVMAMNHGAQCMLPCQLQRYVRVDSFWNVRPYPTISLVVGNARRDSLRVIWKSSRMRKAKELVPPEICQFCGFTNWCCWFQEYSACGATARST